MAPKFVKPTTGPLGDFDGFDLEASYQMVPVGESRFMSVVTDAQGGTLRVGNPQFVSLKAVRSNKVFQGSPTPTLVNLPADSTTTFEIFGDTSGRTTLILEDSSGKPVDPPLIVSIKMPFRKSVNFCFLADIRRSSSFDPIDVPKIFSRVKRTFLVQSNVVLDEQKRGGFNVNVPKDLGNPMNPELSPVFKAVVDATPTEAFMSDFIVYLCWNLVAPGKDIGGVAFQGTTICFCEDDGRGSGGFFASAVMAHELGHLMGLDHFQHANGGLMNKADISSSRLFQFEIDTVNPT